MSVIRTQVLFFYICLQNYQLFYTALKWISVLLGNKNQAEMEWLWIDTGFKALGLKMTFENDKSFLIPEISVSPSI